MAERRYAVVFYTAVLVALAATYGVYRMLEKTKESNQVVTVPVIVAAQDLPEGSRIERISVTANQYPAAAVPSGAYSTPDSVVGRVTRVAVFKGEAIVPGRLAPPGTGPGLEVKITPGKRAMAVKINDVVGLSGLIQPNSRVDVLVTLRDEQNAQSRQQAKVFMSNMRVLSVGTDVERGQDGKPINATTAALEVTPQEAEQLAVAMNQGTIQLVLRGYGDPDSIVTPGATSTDVLAQLRGARSVPVPTAATVSAASSRPAPRRVASRPRLVSPAAPAAQPAVVQRPKQPDTLVVQVFRGDKVSQQKFEKKDSTTSNQ
ncbi:MAG TPA: Flp pilus assembly protein CpaB [Gemmatimonadaceae bacterium]|nr:Flp pilus assembly protein CpaB [Gemmatimonadaceae bacterium]